MPEFIKPYGDTANDGLMQLAFTLPVEEGARARKAALLYLQELNFSEINIAFSRKIAENFTYFVAFARAEPFIDYSQVQAEEVRGVHLDFYQINELIKNNFQQPLVVVGASIGSDAHTVGIDAIMNMKGYNQDYGLERYPQIKTYNLGAQVTSEELLQKAVQFQADAILVSQTVTQKDIHKKNLSALVELLEAEGLRERFLLIAGGSRINNELAVELGYDAGFGPQTLPSQVASFILTSLLHKKGIQC